MDTLKSWFGALVRAIGARLLVLLGLMVAVVFCGPLILFGTIIWHFIPDDSNDVATPWKRSIGAFLCWTAAVVFLCGYFPGIVDGHTSLGGLLFGTASALLSYSAYQVMAQTSSPDNGLKRIYSTRPADPDMERFGPRVRAEADLARNTPLGLHPVE